MRVWFTGGLPRFLRLWAMTALIRRYPNEGNTFSTPITSERMDWSDSAESVLLAFSLLSVQVSFR